MKARHVLCHAGSAVLTRRRGAWAGQWPVKTRRGVRCPSLTHIATMLTLVKFEKEATMARPKKTKMPSDREAVLLQALVAGEKYGLELQEEYESRTGGRMAPGSL